MSLFNPKQLRQKLASEYAESDNYEKVLDFVARFQGQERRQFRAQEFRARYHLGVQTCAENNFAQAHKHFSEAVQLAPTRSDLRLCEARLATLNKLALNPAPPLPASIKDRKHTCPDCHPDNSFYHCAVCQYIHAIEDVRHIQPASFQPHLDEVYAVGAYRRWWDTQKHNPYSQAVKMAQNENSEILLEPLGILLADFISQGPATGLREKIDYICPLPAQSTRPDSWRNRALGIIGRVISRRFGIPLFQVLEATGRQPNSNRQRKRPHRQDYPFRVNDLDLVQNRRILLLDDIATYRKTVREAGSILRDGGAQNVYGVILAYSEAS